MLDVEVSWNTSRRNFVMELGQHGSAIATGSSVRQREKGVMKVKICTNTASWSTAGLVPRPYSQLFNTICCTLKRLRYLVPGDKAGLQASLERLLIFHNHSQFYEKQSLHSVCSGAEPHAQFEH